MNGNGREDAEAVYGHMNKPITPRHILLWWWFTVAQFLPRHQSKRICHILNNAKCPHTVAPRGSAIILMGGAHGRFWRSRARTTKLKSDSSQKVATLNKRYTAPFPPPPAHNVPWLHFWALSRSLSCWCVPPLSTVRT